MFCRKCGSELKEGAKFCTKCGAPVAPLNQGVNPEIKKSMIPEVKSETEPDIKLSAEPEVNSEIKPEAGNGVKSEVRRDTVSDVQSGNYDEKIRKAQSGLRKSPDNNRMLTVIMIIVLVVAVLVASAAAIYLLKPEWLGLGDNGKANQVEVDSEEGEDEKEEVEDGAEESDDDIDNAVIAETPAPETNAVEAEVEPEEEEIVFEDWDIDIESECASIKSMASDYENCLGNYKKYTFEDGNIIAYVQEGIPVKVIVKKGYKNWNFNREYYGVDSFYTKIYDDMGTRELFYSGSKLCRIIDENGITHDYNSENWDEYNELAEKADQDKREIKQFIRDNI